MGVIESLLLDKDQLVVLESVLLLVAQRPLVQVDEVLAVLRVVVLRRPIVRSLQVQRIITSKHH